MCGGFFHPFFPQNSSSSVDFRAVLHELHFWGEFFDGVLAGGLWWPWLGPFEALHCRCVWGYYPVAGVILFSSSAVFFLNRQYDVLACWICCYSLGSILPFTRKCYSYKILVLNFVRRPQKFVFWWFFWEKTHICTHVSVYPSPSTWDSDKASLNL